MKAIALLVMLFAMVSCSDNKSSGGGSIKERYRDALLSYPRGQITKSKNKGSNRSYYNDGTFSLEPYETIKTSTALKIEGNRIYNYEVETDLTDNTVYKSVVLTSYEESVLDAYLKYPGTLVTNDGIGFSMSFDYVDTVGEIKVMDHVEYEGFFSTRFLCQKNSRTTYSGTITRDNQTTQMPPYTDTTVETCDGIASTEELLAIDLSSIEFCETNLDTTKCESNKDMRFLTDDL